MIYPIPQLYVVPLEQLEWLQNQLLQGHNIELENQVDHN
jgi:hypothetical protein